MNARQQRPLQILGHHSAELARTARPGHQVSSNTMAGTFVEARIVHPHRITGKLLHAVMKGPLGHDTLHHALTLHLFQGDAIDMQMTIQPTEVTRCARRVAQ